VVEGLEAEVCIIGAGPVGGTLACRLAAEGVPTVAIDRMALPPMEHPDFDGRAYAIAAGSRRVLELAGLWDRLPLPANPIEDIRVSDGRPGERASRLFLHFDREDVGAEAFGWMVEARSLRMALNARLNDAPNLRVFAPAEARVERRAEGAVVRIAGGPEVACRLVVAAEGRDSPLREAAGIPVTRFAYRQRGIVCAIAHERAHRNVAVEHFLPAGPFAQLPMLGQPDAPNVSAIVWTEDADTAAELIEFPDDLFAEEVQRRLGDYLGTMRMIGRRWLYPLGALHAHRYYATRLALVGDAAHGIHPIAGQGLNLGFRDVATLSRLLIEAYWAGTDLGDASLLLRYQRARRPDNLLMLGLTDALDRLFSNDVPPIRLVRDLGLAAVNRIPPLKRFFMRTAMGVPAV